MEPPPPQWALSGHMSPAESTRTGRNNEGRFGDLLAEEDRPERLEDRFKRLLSKVGDEYACLRLENRRLVEEVQRIRQPTGAKLDGMQSQESLDRGTESAPPVSWLSRGTTNVSMGSQMTNQLARGMTNPNMKPVRTLSEELQVTAPKIEESPFTWRTVQFAEPEERRHNDGEQSVMISEAVAVPSERSQATPARSRAGSGDSQQVGSTWVPFRSRAKMDAVDLPVVAAPRAVAAPRPVSEQSAAVSTPSRFDSNPSVNSGLSGRAVAFTMRSKRKTSVQYQGKRLTMELALASAHVSRAKGESIALNPLTSRFLHHWDRTAALALLFVVVVSPVHVAMFEPKLDVMFGINCMIDSVFFVDMLLQFFIMYPRDIRYGHMFEYSLDKIARRYLRSWFIIDLISVLPIDVLSMLTSWGNLDTTGSIKALKVVRILRLMKLARVMRAPRMLDRFEFRMTMTYKTLSLIQFFAILTILTHWLTSLWALTLALVDPDEGLPRWIDDFEELDQNVSNKTIDTPWKLYITCLYFTTYTLTSVGYGDIGPKNIVERIICTLMIIISGTSWAVVIGQVGGIISNMNPAEREYRAEMDDLQHMMKEQKVSDDIQERITLFFKSYKIQQRRARHERLMQAMSPNLRGAVVTQVHSERVTHVPMLNSIWQEAECKNSLLLRNFIYDVTTSMHIEAHAQGEVFGAPHVLYIMNRGLVGRGPRIHVWGAVWGLDFLLADPRLLDPVECVALTYVEVTKISRSVFFQLVEKHRVGCPKLQHQVRYFTRWFAFQRAIRYKAKLARKQIAHYGRIQQSRGMDTMKSVPQQDVHVPSASDVCAGTVLKESEHLSYDDF